MIQSLQDLFEFILRQDRTIVFGNLGRHLPLLLETLLSIPLLRVIIVSDRCNSSSADNRIHIQRSTDPIDKCDLLLYLEPSSHKLVIKHPLVSRVVVFTSHYTFKRGDNEPWIHVCYFRGMDLEGTAELLKRQDLSIQTRNVGLVERDHITVQTLSGKVSMGLKEPNTYVIINLIPFNKDILSMYLAFWDAFDYMLENRAYIDRWVICFSETGHSAFKRFTQKIIDALFCIDFEYGNVTDKATLLSMLPFYTSGVITKQFDIPVSSFGGIEFVAPKSVEDACKAAAMHNVTPLVKNILWIH